MSDMQLSLLSRIVDRVFPKSPDFFALLAAQCRYVGVSVGRMVDYMETGSKETGELVRKDEQEADRIKVQNIHICIIIKNNLAFPEDSRGYQPPSAFRAKLIMTISSIFGTTFFGRMREWSFWLSLFRAATLPI